GVGHLRGHETDRLQALSTELTKVGARTIEHEDGLEIHPGSLHGTEFETYEDHRIATAAAIIGLKVPDMKVVNIGTTAKTLPDFVGMWLSMLHAQGPEGEQRGGGRSATGTSPTCGCGPPAADLAPAPRTGPSTRTRSPPGWCRSTAAGGGRWWPPAPPRSAP